MEKNNGRKIDRTELFRTVDRKLALPELSMYSDLFFSFLCKQRHVNICYAMS